MENLVNDLTQKDENKAVYAAKTLINTMDTDAFQKLCDKSEFLFDFVKENVRKRIKKVITPQNYKNVAAFFKIYNENYADLFIDILAEFADEELSDEMFELLENGNKDEKKYAAKYFSYIPDTIARDLLAEYSFDEDIELAANSARALGAMRDEASYAKALSLLNSKDDFEIMKAVKFLTVYGRKSAVKDLLKTLQTSSMAENIAGEIPYLMGVLDMFEKENFDEVVTCFDFILIGLGEILPLSAVFDYEIFETLEYLLKKAETEDNSQISAVLLRALEKFNTLTSNDEYIFDEQKDVKQEVKAISDLLKTFGQDFWNKQQKLISNELTETKHRASAALEIIRSLEIKSASAHVLEFIKNCTDEQILVQALGTAKVLDLMSEINSGEILSKISESTLKAIASSYFV